jgi:Putative Flp pilus-assembly TadE/G-like
MISTIARRLRDESGQAMIVTLLCLTCLLGMVAMAADVGTLFYSRRNLQIAADAAAIAGAGELSHGNMNAAGIAAAAQNGVVVGTNGGWVNMSSPPTGGAYAGLAGGYVEAIVSQTEPTFFMKIFGKTSQTVAARAVAYSGGSSNGCVYILSGNASPAMDLQGSFDVSAPACSVIINSNDPDALQFTGAKGTLTAGSVGVAGGDGGQVGDSTPAPVTGIAQVSDPYNGYTGPTPTGCTTPAGGKLTGTVSPGCYSAPAKGTLTINNANLNTGTYVLQGNVNLTGTVTSNAGGTTLDIVNGALTEGTNTVLNLVAPLPGSGPPGGIAIMEPPTNSNLLLFDFGSSSGSITGVIYAPNAPMELHDSGGDKSGGLKLITDLIVNTLKDQTATLSITSYSQTTPGTPLTKIALVE